MIAHGLRRPAGHGRGLDAGPRRPVDPQLEVDAVPKRRAPGRSYVTRRAVVDVVRMAVLGSYGVTGISDPSLGRRLLRWSGLGQSGIRVSLDRTVAIEVDLTVGAGLPILEVARQVDSAVRYAVRRSLGLDVDELVVHVNGLRYEPNRAQASSAVPATVEPAAGPDATATSDAEPPTVESLAGRR
jgi:uncharacterized alkaline shock family protein YloU